MSASETNTVVATGTGNSEHITLPGGDHLLMVTASAWGTTFLQVGNGTSFVDAKDDNGDKISFTEDDSVVAKGGLSYRLRTTSFSADITLAAVRIPKS